MVRTIDYWLGIAFSLLILLFIHRGIQRERRLRAVTDDMHSENEWTDVAVWKIPADLDETACADEDDVGTLYLSPAAPTSRPTTVGADIMALDLAALTISDSDEDLTSNRRGAGRPAMDNPFGPILADSFANDGRTKVLVVENDKERSEKSGEPKNVATIKGLIRRAADKNSLGVRLISQETNSREKHTPVKEGETGRFTVIKFAAKEKTLRPRKTAENVEANGDATVTDITPTDVA